MRGELHRAQAQRGREIHEVDREERWRRERVSERVSER